MHNKTFFSFLHFLEISLQILSIPLTILNGIRFSVRISCIFQDIPGLTVQFSANGI